MSAELHIAHSVWTEMHRDLDRPHSFAYERVGFLTIQKARASSAADVRVEALRWERVDDVDYLRDDRVGASIGPEAFRKILQRAHFDVVGILHVHRHHHQGKPAFSRTDIRSMRAFIPSFFNAQSEQVHGALLLSLDSAIGVIRETRNAYDRPISRIIINK